MTPGARDVAQIRLANALLLFDEFVHANVKSPTAATLRGLEGRFAERLQIQPSYWSQIKSRSRQVGERLARQFEQLCGKPSGWMDVPHRARGGDPSPAVESPGADAIAETAPAHQPQDDDERFIVGLVLTYYRRHPQRARARLLDLLGEVLTPTAPPASRSATAAPPPDEGFDLWSKTRAGASPLKRKR